MRMYCQMGFVLALATMLSASYVFAAGVSSEKEAIALAESALKKIAADDIEGAMAILKPHTCLEWGEFSVLAKGTAMLYSVRPNGFGDSVGYSYIEHESIGDTVLRVTFIQKLKRKPLQWDVFFYKPEQEWLFWGIHFQASPAAIFNLATPPSIQRGPQPTSR